ncbi:MAG: class I SAM-dependent methyltransferase [Verrucomicrobiota bacterium]
MRSRIGLVTTLLQAGHEPNQILVKLALRTALSGCASVLDIGCGMNPTLRQLGVSQTCGAEGYAPSFNEARRQNTHDQLVQCDVRELSRHFQPGQFDACIALDVIEHLAKPDGLKLLADMERIARKRVVIFTPSGFLEQHHASNDDLQEHLSGWEAAEMERLGYHVTGQLGPKSLRGEYHALKRRPAAFWGLVSLAGQLTHSQHHPAEAAAILCVKTLAGN